MHATNPDAPPLLIFADDWGRHPSSCQHLARHLLGRRAIHWINTIGMRPPRFDRATLLRALEKARHWGRPSPAPAGEGGLGPRVVSPRMWPWFRSALDRRINRELLVRQLIPLARAGGGPPTIVTTIPIVADLVGLLPAARWVYYCVDDFGQWPGLDRRAMAAMEDDLVARVDQIVAASEVLRDRMAARGREATLLTHGVDLDHWTAGDAGPPIPGLDGLPRPLVAFWGVVDRRLDFAVLRHLDGRMAAGTILLVGPEQDPDPRLAGLNRIVRLPCLPYGRLPRLAREASVLIMPYADLPVTRAMQPLKLKEYLATGRPAVVADLPATRPWADALDLAGTPEAFASAVLDRIATGLPEPQRTARLGLAAESWSAKAEAFDALLGEASSRPAATTPSPARSGVR